MSYLSPRLNPSSQDAGRRAPSYPADIKVQLDGAAMLDSGAGGNTQGTVSPRNFAPYKEDAKPGADHGVHPSTSISQPLRLELQRSSLRMNASRAKRALDVFGALVGLIVLSPILCVFALMIRAESPGPALFTQWRTGRNGAPFRIYKLRTMRVTEDGATVVQAKRTDSRVTTIGRFLRKSSIDELPQLYNILKGDMSLVGPRPHALAHDSQFGAAISYYDLRFLTRPGLTGLAQVAGHRGETPNDDAMKCRVDRDLEYIRTWSFALDLKILMRTALVAAFHPSAY